MNINSNINQMDFENYCFELPLINKIYVIKRRNVKRKNAQTGKGADVIAYNFFTKYKFFLRQDIQNRSYL